MSERWMPEVCESYYYIDSVCGVNENKWHDVILDEIRHKKGNCFKTFSEAQLAAEKVKALLLSLHDSTQDKPLPKLTAEVFDRPDCPKDAKIAVVTKNGSAYWGSSNTARLNSWGGWKGEKCFWVSIPGKWDASDWQNSLIKRPVKETKLPDWCKPGEWVYLSNGKYYKIESIDEYGVDLSVGIHIGRNSIHAEAVAARLRPYNADEMRELVGKVVVYENKYYSLVIMYDGKDNAVLVGDGDWCSESTLLKDFTINGQPCGVLEHLENGKWVQ